jgi:molybdate transport system substrate-binding protein
MGVGAIVAAWDRVCQQRFPEYLLGCVRWLDGGNAAGWQRGEEGSTVGEVRVFSTTAMQTTLEALAPSFEQATGHTLTFAFAPSGRTAKKVADGEAHDVAIVTAAGIDELIASGRIVPGTRADLVRSPIGLAVRQGAPRPDISSVEAFKQTLLAAKSVAISHPTGGAQSGAHLAKLFERLGIADAMKPKSIYGPGGPAGLIGYFLLRGEAEIGLQQLPELMAVSGIDVIGTLPQEIQLVTVFSAGLSSAANNAAGGRAWIDHLRTPQAAAVIVAKGMEPG